LDVGIDDATAAKAILMAKTIRPERFTIFDTGITEDSAKKLVRMLYTE